MEQPSSPQVRPPGGRPWRRRTLGVVIGLGVAVSPVGAWATSQPLPTGMDLVVAALQQSVDAAFSDVQLPEIPDGTPLVVRAQTQHAANWLVEHLLADRLLSRGYPVTLDSAAVGDASLQLTYRVLDLKVSARSGLLSAGIRRQSKSSLAFALSRGDTLCWQGEYHGQQSDRIPKGRADLLQNPNPEYAFAQAEIKTQSWGSFVEPVIVSTVLGGLVYLFFSNR
ncbi:MAG: hypothetical protein AB1505_28250 [Candidatus Latescibacterota bacterium]